MAALDTFSTDIPWLSKDQREALLAGVREEIGKHLWAWFEQNADDKLFERKVLGFIPVRIHVRDCRPLMVLLFGPNPVAA